MNVKKYKRICILDTETTDRYWNRCGPIQIAAEVVDDKGNVIDSFNERIKTTCSYLAFFCLYSRCQEWFF